MKNVMPYERYRRRRGYSSRRENKYTGTKSPHWGQYAEKAVLLAAPAASAALASSVAGAPFAPIPLLISGAISLAHQTYDYFTQDGRGPDELTESAQRYYGEVERYRNSERPIESEQYNPADWVDE